MLRSTLQQVSHSSSIIHHPNLRLVSNLPNLQYNWSTNHAHLHVHQHHSMQAITMRDLLDWNVHCRRNLQHQNLRHNNHILMTWADWHIHMNWSLIHDTDGMIIFQQLPALLYVLYAIIDRAWRITREKTKAKVQVANAIEFINSCTKMPQAAAIFDQILGFKPT